MNKYIVLLTFKSGKKDLLNVYCNNINDIPEIIDLNDVINVSIYNGHYEYLKNININNNSFTIKTETELYNFDIEFNLSDITSALSSLLKFKNTPYIKYYKKDIECIVNDLRALL